MNAVATTAAISAPMRAWLDGEVTARESLLLTHLESLARERLLHAECKSKRLRSATDYHRRRMLRAYLEIRAARKWQ